MRFQHIVFYWSLVLPVVMSGCDSSDQPLQPEETPEINEPEAADSTVLEVVSVTTSGTENQYTFHVEIKSPDKGCDQYADWWEVIDTSGKLLYRRVLLHSHVNEQPFQRSGGPVAISSDREVLVRGHMNNQSYSLKVMRGSPGSGFVRDTLAADFAMGLEKEDPLPEDCDF